MDKNMSKSDKLRAGIVVGTLAAALVVTAVLGFWQANKYRRQLEMTYLRSLEELSSYVADISSTLNKGVYAGSPAQMTSLSAKLWRDAGSAKASLSALPLEELDLTDTYRFLSQVGDYAMTLSRKVANSQELTEEELRNLDTLCTYAQNLNEQINAVQGRVSSGEIPLDRLAAVSVQKGNGADGEQQQAGGGGFEELENSFDGYPRLIYDGPFSDNILDRQPRLTKGQPEISQENAQKKAAQAAGVNPSALTFEEMENSTMPSYCFGGDNINIGVTKNGGFVTYLINGRDIGDKTIDSKQAISIARKYLEGLGIESMRETYYEIANNICTINFAYQQDGVVCYTDLIKVGVAMDNGDIVSLDTRGYIVNHQSRQIPAPALTREEAMEKVSHDGVITVEESKTAETYSEVVEGMQFDRGYITPYMATDMEKMEANLDDPYILITDKKISNIQEILPVLEQIGPRYLTHELSSRGRMSRAEAMAAQARLFQQGGKMGV